MKKLLLLTLALAMCCWLVASAANEKTPLSLNSKAPVVSQKAPATNSSVSNKAPEVAAKAQENAGEVIGNHQEPTVADPSALLSNKAPVDEAYIQKLAREAALQPPPIPTAILLTEGFENAGAIPAGWSDIGGFPWLYNGGTTHGPGSVHGGSYAAYYDIWDYDYDSYDTLRTPSLDFSAYSHAYTLKYWSWHSSGTDSVVVYLNEAGTLTRLQKLPNTTVWTLNTVLFNSTSADGKIDFIGYSNYGSYNLYIDDVEIADAPSVGRCCYGDPTAPSCADNSPTDCATLGGTWSAGLTCAGDPCPAALLGDACSAPFLIPSIPYSDARSSCGFTNDYGYSGPDVVYKFTLATAMTLDLTLCGSPTAWDTELSVWADGACGTTTYIADEDGGCGGYLLSRIAPLTLDPGTYYVLVDGWGVCNNYVLDITEYVECDVVCPTPSTPENEPTCYDDYVDVTNVGCNALNYDPPGVPVYGAIADGETICGTGGDFTYLGSTGYRDTDWFTFTLTEPTVVTVNGEAEFAGALYFITAGNPTPCTGYSITYSTSYMACVPFSLSGILNAGEYWVWVGSDGSGQPCGSEYYITMAQEPYVPPPPDVFVTLPADIPYSDVNTTCGMVNDYANTCLGSYDGGEDIVYEVTVTSAVEVDILLNPGADTYTGIAIDGSYPLDPTTCIAVSTNYSAGVHGIYGLTLDPGTYYIMIDTWPSPACIAEYTLTIDVAAPPPTPDFVVTAPGSWSGTTCGAANDCNLRPSEEHIYEVTIPTAGTWIFSLCGSPTTWDSFLELGTESCSNDLGYSDDYCGALSQLSAGLAAGTYYVTIEGYGDASCGDYLLEISQPPLVECPPINTPEGEPTCYDDYVDITNAGCNALNYDPPGEPVYGSITDGETICGTSGDFTYLGSTGYRDTDWYTLSLAEAKVVTVTGAAQFTGSLFFINEPCPGTIAYSTSISNGFEFTLSATLDAGEYWIWVGSSGIDNNPCGSVYYITLTLEDPPPPPPDLCVDPIYSNGPIGSVPNAYAAQCDPVYPLSVGCADDFILPGTGSIDINEVSAYYGFWNHTPAGTPADFDGVVVTFYADNGGMPGGRPVEPDVDCAHVELVPGGLISSQVILPGSYTYAQLLSGYWQINIPISTVTLTAGTTYWFEFEPIMIFSNAGQVGWTNTDGIIGNPAMQISDVLALPTWTVPSSGAVDMAFCLKYATGGEPIYSVNPTSANGNATIGNTDTDLLTVSNTGTGPLNFTVTVAQDGSPTPVWLSTDVTNGSIPAGGSLPVTVTMNSTGLTAGTYTGRVVFNTNELGATIHEVPVNFIVSTPGACAYVVGDVNNNAAFNGIDVTYGVSYFKGGNVPPYSCLCGASTWYVAGDVNASCVFNGIDITYMVSYFKGGPAPHPCATCPPASVAKVPTTIIETGNNQ